MTTNTKSSADHVKEAAAGKTDERAMSQAHHIDKPGHQPPSASAAAQDIPANDRAVNDLLKRVAQLERWLAHLQDIYKWPLPDGMVPATPPRVAHESDN